MVLFRFWRNNTNKKINKDKRVSENVCDATKSPMQIKGKKNSIYRLVEPVLSHYTKTEKSQNQNERNRAYEAIFFRTMFLSAPKSHN